MAGPGNCCVFRALFLLLRRNTENALISRHTPHVAIISAFTSSAEGGYALPNPVNSRMLRARCMSNLPPDKIFRLFIDTRYRPRGLITRMSSRLLPQSTSRQCGLNILRYHDSRNIRIPDNYYAISFWPLAGRRTRFFAYDCECQRPCNAAAGRHRSRCRFAVHEFLRFARSSSPDYIATMSCRKRSATR